MRTLGLADKDLSNEIYSSVIKKWKWDWPEEKANILIGKKIREVIVHDTILNVDFGGWALYGWCSDTMNYGSKGKCTIVKHLRTARREDWEDPPHQLLSGICWCYGKLFITIYVIDVLPFYSQCNT